jgi:hypothetical protein
MCSDSSARTKTGWKENCSFCRGECLEPIRINAIPHFATFITHIASSTPPASFLEFGRPTTRRKSGSGVGREEEEEEAPTRGHAPSTPHTSHADRHDKGSDRHRHRTPRSHDKRAPAIPLDQGDSTPAPLIPSTRDRSGSSRPRSSKSKHGSGTESPAEGASISCRQQHSSLISLREEADSLPLTREVQDLMARQKVSALLPLPSIPEDHPVPAGHSRAH